MKKTVILMMLLVVISVGSAFAQNIAGDWQGTLKVGQAELRLVLHITRNADGNFRATMDSVDQRAMGIPVSSVTLKDSQLSLSVDAVHGTYEGKVSADVTIISGTWTQGRPLPLDFKRSSAAIKTGHKPAKPSDIDGAWMGTLDTGLAKLRVIFHITNTEDGLTATLDSPDQGAKGIPATTVARTEASLRIEVKSIAGAFEGKINQEATTIEGAWTQMGNALPLVLKRTSNTSELERRRPQTPKKPYPYREEEVRYDNKEAGLSLAATLTIPPGKGPFPAVVLITGSGPQDRDEAIMGHRPFLILADHLTRKGIAVLRADDRGFGKSGGNFATATTADFATDAEAGAAYLKTRPEVDSYRIGLIGHSEGGIVAAMVAARNPEVTFIVMMAGTGVTGDQVLAEQTLLISEVGGQSRAAAEKSEAEEREILTLVKRDKDDAVLEKDMRERLAGKIPEAQLESQLKAVTSPWFRFFIDYDPAIALRKVKCPVLAINGEKDLQVPPKQNLPAIRKALVEGGNRNFEVDELPGLNHLFQTAKTGAVSEYAEIEETISPMVLEKIAGWILNQSGKSSNR